MARWVEGKFHGEIFMLELFIKFWGYDFGYGDKLAVERILMEIFIKISN